MSHPESLRLKNMIWIISKVLRDSFEFVIIHQDNLNIIYAKLQFKFLVSKVELNALRKVLLYIESLVEINWMIFIAIPNQSYSYLTDILLHFSFFYYFRLDIILVFFKFHILILWKYVI